MNEQEQRIAIAEACGWKGPDHPHTRNHIKDWPYSHDKRVWVLNPKGGVESANSLPDYLNDLNAMRCAIESQPEATKKAIRAEVWRLSSQMTVLPPASVFAEAFLRVTEKWKP